jgi:hypothetical protein
MQTVEVTLFIVVTGAGKDRSRQAGVEKPGYGKGTGRQVDSGSGGRVQGKKKKNRRTRKEKLGNDRS